MTAQRIVLITGSSRGIGAATARLAAAQGYDVAVNYGRDKEGAAAVVADIEKVGRRAVAIQADVAREDDVARLFETIDHKLCRLTDLVYNAGITGPMSRIENLSTDAAREVLDINVLGCPHRARGDPAALDRAGRGRGRDRAALVRDGDARRRRRIRDVCGLQGRCGEPLDRPCPRARRRGHPRQLVEPGPTDTGIHPPGRLERLSKVVPLGRPGTPEEIAEAVMFLISDRSSFTTGAVLRVAGGR